MESADVLMEEKKLMAEAKYRNYMSNIDKALRNFEYSSEWADLISALGKLSKAISSNTQYQIIPRRIKISKRLAQCMHPALPSGVHLKALETYAVIFGKTGPERLATELFIYSSGLFPLLGYAAMNVRPALLGIYETYFVPLGEKLRPALSGFLSGVLPGYECGLDHFERTSSLLTQVCTAVNPTHFYTVLWECVATNASVRLPAISYLLEHFNKRTTMQEQIYVMGHNRDIMMSGLCACLNDTLILVQRNTLEFLLLGFPMHTKLLSEMDLIKLVTNGLHTILRRDMSLNRRLYSWLLGSEVMKNSPTYEDVPVITTTDGAEQTKTYFEQHSRHVVIQALISTLKFSLQCSPVDLKPYRIMVSLLDKAEIGSAVLDYVLCDIIRTMSLSNGNVEVIKSSNLLFATFDPAYIWSFMTTMFEKSCKKTKKVNNGDSSKKSYNRSISNDQRFQCVVGSGDPSLVEICYLTEFLLETISLEMYNETTRIYLPKVFLAITQMLTVHLENLTNDEVTASLKLCMKIVSRVQPMITPIKLMPRNSQQGYKSSDNEKADNSSTRAQPISAILGANALEKSKSDSKLDQFANPENMNKSMTSARDEEHIRRSNSNQHMERKSPTKKKKAKSFSKLSELDKEICPDTGQLIDPRQSSSDLDTPTSIKKIKAKANRLRMSPKKVRPQELSITHDKSSSSIRDSKHSYNDPVDTPDYEFQDDEPKSAPLEQPSKQHAEGFIFNYQDICNQQDDLQQQEASATSTILEKCIKQYEIFFEVYLSHKVLQITTQLKSSKCFVKVQVQNQDTLEAENKLPNVENIFKHEQVYEDINPCRILDIDNLFETLKIHVVNRSKQLHTLLNRSLNDAQSENTDGSENGDVEENSYEIDELTKKRLQTLLQLQLSPSLRQAIKLSVNLLVEMSTFPNCNKNITLEKNENDLPSWLKVLCIVACYTQNDKELQLSSITTLFDLISLLKSQIEHTTSPGVTFVVMLPLLKFGHVHYIERHTKVFQLLTSKLWDYLGEHEVDNTQVCALLYQLHNCLESGLVERIIDNRMFAKTMQQHFSAAYEMSETKRLQHGRKQEKLQTTALSAYNSDRATDVHMMCVAPTFLVQRSSIEKLSESESISFKKYELLWHLGRDKQQTRGFEKLQFKVLDTLALPPYMSVRTCVTKWLQSALLRGDLSRLVKPLYKILLASNTKRISIVHIHLLQKGSDDNVNSKASSLNGHGKNNNPTDVDSSVEADVYAVSSEYGNIRYITDSTSHHKKRSPIRSFHKKIFGVALSSKNKTSNFVSDQTASTSTSPNIGGIDVAVPPSTPIGVIVNPLENSLDFDDDHEPETLQVKEKLNIKETQMEDEDPDDLEEDENDDAAFDQDYTDESDSSIFDSESEQRETSVEKDDSITQTFEYESKSDLKRYVGHTESVTELLSQHDRIKNRKTYHLTREKTPGDTSLTSTTTDEHGPFSLEMDQLEDDAHAAEEYFDSKSDERQVESFVEDLIEQVRDTAITKRKKKLKNRIKKLKSNKSPLGHKEKMDSKRMSCISKISTDSNNSFTTGEIAKESAEDEEDSTSKFINIEEKRKTLNLETTAKSHNKEWELTPETIEKSKQNLEILRQSATSQLAKQDASSKRSSTKSCTSFESSMTKRFQNEKLLPLYQNHMLIYMNVYDTKQTLYAFHTLRNIISCDTRTFLCLSITTSLSSGSLKQLLTRHRKCIAGKGFAGSITTSEFAQSYRGCMHLEVLLLLCLFYARGFFHVDSHDSASEPPTRADVMGNCRVQLESIELLTLICAELIEIVKGMGKGLACYLADLMARCKLQKVILHCLNSSVNTYGHHYQGSTMAEQIINFNNPQDDNLHAEAFQIQLLRLLMVVIKLEYEVTLLKNDSSGTGTNEPTDSGSISPTRLTSGEPSLSSVKYLPNCVISQQPMFLSAILSALQDERLQPLHHNWTDLVTSSLNCFNFGSLTNIVISVVHQLCNNIDQLTKMKLKDQVGLPPDYVISQLEAITVLCHYCLLDNTQQTTLSQLFNQAYPQTSAIASQNSNTGQLFNSIVHSLLPAGVTSISSTTSQADVQAPKNQQLMAARNAVLSHLPRIVSSVAAIWDSDLGQIRQIKQQLMEFLSPISLHHGANFLAAIAVTWQERGEQHRKKCAHEYKNLTIPQQYQRNSMPQACAEQLSLVSLVSSIRVMPMDSFVQTLHQVVKSPPPIHRPPSNLKIEVSALELFYFYMKSAPAPQLGDSWTSLLALLKDGLSLTPSAQFTLLMLLNEFVQRCPQMPFQDKKDIRDLHDVTSRLVDSLSNIAGSCLEQTTWLRRNLAVKEDITPMVTDGDTTSTSSAGGTSVIQKYSVQAQSVLAAILANLLDVAYGSQEKDKVVSIITTLLYNITPYLKNHTTRNIPSFYACSSLLASLSGYQYTRKAWRKDMMDLLLDTSFFQMDITCLPFWKQIMDSLMTYDNTTFRELMSRVSLTQTGSLNIFTSREQEYEQRSMLLKRLAFVIFCSEFDQYHKYMPEIQEQLANSLRLLSNVPSVQAAVFLCFRVLLLRMSPDHVTSLWPIIIAEMVQVFLSLEQELKGDGEDVSRMVSGMDASWSSSAANNGLSTQSQIYYWRSVQLEASKLLEMGCVLPATLLPHFQMYRWAFVGTEFDVSDKAPIPNGVVNEESIGMSALYVPHIRRIARLMDMKYAVHSPTLNFKRGKHLMLTCQQINSLQDLYGFFSTLSVACPNPHNHADVDTEVNNCLQEIEDILSKDFLEKMPTSTTPR
ncbi:protein dopey-1 homolog isoform X2 [Lucilia cuprina]|uniref:protein dopey-1 homolog isoform X2 n=1 Tax=Lucilia cuprina TaxID=7375 RepID=UPI001F062BDE|nr:protein dopey-1 homolog isoform X2 [Lucilia cuprina]